MQNIKIFFNSQHLLITNNEPKDLRLYAQIVRDEEAVFEFRNAPHILFNESCKHHILLITPFVEEALESIFDFADGIVAAGGIVKNSKNEILLIHRRGFWDMAKGKVEKMEKINHAALREVLEETGLPCEITDDEPIKTYHCYRLKNKDCIKETYWYPMKPENENNLLTPQKEEDIEMVKWANWKEIKATEKEFYPLIFDLISKSFEE